MSGQTGQKKSGGTKKYGRNKSKCETYKLQGRRERNKKRRAEKRERWLEARQLKVLE